MFLTVGETEHYNKSSCYLLTSFFLQHGQCLVLLFSFCESWSTVLYWTSSSVSIQQLREFCSKGESTVANTCTGVKLGANEPVLFLYLLLLRTAYISWIELRLLSSANCELFIALVFSILAGEKTNFAFLFENLRDLYKWIGIRRHRDFIWRPEDKDFKTLTFWTSVEYLFHSEL